MAQYEYAESDAEAWRIYRELVHCLDRRFHVESARRGWPDALSRTRALNHQLGLADAERLFRRNEGDLSRAYGGIVFPSQIPPWSVIAPHSDPR
jgi:hypothetical protein